MSITRPKAPSACAGSRSRDPAWVSRCRWSPSKTGVTAMVHPGYQQRPLKSGRGFDKERLQLLARRAAAIEVERVHDRKPEPAGRHRVLLGRTILVEGDLDARYARGAAQLFNEV